MRILEIRPRKFVTLIASLPANAVRVAFLTAIVLLAGSLASVAQSYYGSLRGVVQDPKGAAVSGATVTLTDQSTNVARTTVTLADGAYVFNSVNPATYTVTVEATGFEKAVHSDIVISVQQQ